MTPLSKECVRVDAVMCRRTGQIGLGPADHVHLRVLGTTLTFRWGCVDGIGTPAYWVNQAAIRPETIDNRLADSLPEEIVACLLGGYGVSAEAAARAFRQLQQKSLVRTDATPTEAELASELAAVGYRFHRQRSARVASALRALSEDAPPNEPLELRAWLLELPGVGPKTASWIVRNQMESEDVAVIDIHVRRAGVAAGFFAPEWSLPRDYGRFEQAFLAVAAIGGVKPSRLDAIMWMQMRAFGAAAKTVLPRTGHLAACSSH